MQQPACGLEQQGMPDAPVSWRQAAGMRELMGMGLQSSIRIKLLGCLSCSNESLQGLNGADRAAFGLRSMRRSGKRRGARRVEREVV